MRRALLGSALGLLLVGCVDVDRYPPGPQDPRPEEILVVTSARPAAGAPRRAEPVPTAVAGEQARAARGAAPIQEARAVQVESARPPVPAAQPTGNAATRRAAAPAAVASSAEARAAAARVQAQSQARARVAAGPDAPRALPRPRAEAGAQLGLDDAQVQALTRGVLPADDPRCAEGFLPEVDPNDPTVATLPRVGSPETQRALARMQAGCGLDGAELTPELLRAMTAAGLPLPQAGAAADAQARAGTLDRRVADRNEAFLRAAPPARQPAPLPADDTRPTTAIGSPPRPPSYNGVRDAITGAPR